MYRKRLKNVYELLEAGNNKKVIQEVDKLVSNSSLTSATTTVNLKKKQLQQLQQGVNESGPIIDEQTVLVIAKALKSLALLRTGRKQEADRLIDDLLDSNTTDENALSIVMQYCKETQQLSKIVFFYENAVNKCQNDVNLVNTNEHEEILSSLFYAHLRNRDFLKQQQVALKLFKQTNKMMFCFWNAASYIMMSKADNTNVSQQQKAMYLQLGEKILQKAYEDQKSEYSGEYLLYLSILEERNKFEEALKIVEAFNQDLNGSKLGLIDFKVKKKMLYLKHLKRWNDLRKLCELYLADETNANLDDWLTYLEYLDVVLELYKESTNKNEFVEDILAYFKLLIDRIEIKKLPTDDSNQSTKAQGPYLAQLEFLTRLVNLPDNSNNYIELFKQFFKSYINMFASKPGFYFDFIYFKKIILKLNLSEFILELLKQLHDANRPFKTIKSIYTCLSYWQMNRYFGKQKELNTEDSLKLAVEFEALYKEGLEFGKDMLPTSFQYADEFLIMAVHIRYDLYKKNPNNTNSILQMIINLKHGLVHSPANYQLKLLLLNLYSHLGAYDSLQATYDSMEIKNIQNYSTANLLLIHNIRLGALGSSYSTYTSMDHFFTSNLFDMANYLVYCFKYGTFLKAIEIYSFMNTIGKSLTLNLCLTNTMCISFLMHPIAPLDAADSAAGVESADPILAEFKTLQNKIDGHLKEIANVSGSFNSENGLLPDDDEKLKELLLDHNDKKVLYNWEPEEEDILANNQYQLVIDEQRRLLKLRNIMVRFADHFLKSWFNDNLDNNKFDLYKSKLIDFDFKPLITNEEEFDLQLKVYITKSNYFSRWSELNLDKLMICLVNLSSDLCQNEKFLDNQLITDHKELKTYKDLFKQSADLLRSRLDLIINDLNKNFKIEKISKLLECFTASLECLSFSILMFTACLTSQRMRPLWSEKMKKSKKKKGLYAQHVVSVDLIYEIFEILINLISFYSTQLKQVICPNISSQTQALFSSQESTIKLTGSSVSSVYLNDISQSYVKSFDELRSNFNHKLKYLSKFSGNSSIMSQIMENLKLN
jgi:N-terminal acetyltransferase B complex non-catalytic subunit